MNLNLNEDRLLEAVTTAPELREHMQSCGVLRMADWLVVRDAETGEYGFFQMQTAAFYTDLPYIGVWLRDVNWTCGRMHLAVFRTAGVFAQDSVLARVADRVLAQQPEESKKDPGFLHMVQLAAIERPQ